MFTYSFTIHYMRIGDKTRAQKDLDHYAEEELSSTHFEAGLQGALKSTGHDTADGLIAKGLNAERSKDLDSAISYFSQAIEQDRHNPAPYKFRAHTYELKGDSNKALGDYDVALLIEPFDGNALVNRAANYERLGQIEKALWDLNRAISADPVLANAFFAKANLCAKLGKKQDAQLNYQRFIKVALLNTDKGTNAKLATAMKALGKSNEKQ